MIEQDELDKIVGDTSINGKMIEFYEMLQNSLEQYSDSRIKQMKDTLLFVNDATPVNQFDKLRIIYEYSKLI